MAPAPKKEDSVFDFLYVDSRRVAVFLSQFGQFGHLTQIIKSATDSSKAGGGFDVKVAKMDTSETATESIQKQFDAQWVAPLAFLDEANKRGMIVRHLAQARIGQLVLDSGTLSVTDLSIVKEMWKLPAIRSMILQGAETAIQTSTLPRAERRRNEKHNTETATTEPSPVDAGIELISILPHSIQARLVGDSGQIWCNLRDDGIIVSSSDLLLKHGVNIAGKWNIIGILDAFPDDALPETTNVSVTQGAIIPLVALFEAGIVPFTRALLGRPASSYGMTPILIFREVGADA